MNIFDYLFIEMPSRITLRWDFFETQFGSLFANSVIADEQAGKDKQNWTN